MFSGSYEKEDVIFLLKVIDIDFTDIQEKENLVLSGKKHYSELINKEYIPTKHYLKTFYQVYKLNRDRFAQDILSMAYNLSLKKEIVIVSLARAGTPIGVLLKRVLRDVFHKNIQHYSISIIRDREIDKNAINYIYSKHPNHEFIFVDGWTGKGVINKELKKSIAQYNRENKRKVSDKIYVISDIAGIADFSVTHEDYLIPSSALNATISGLISRSILNDNYIQKDDFHGCKYYEEFKDADISKWFIDDVLQLIKTKEIKHKALLNKDEQLISLKEAFINKIMQHYLIKDINHIKPGIGETTRVLLRRIPYLIIVQNIRNKDIEHILQLAKEKDVKVIEDINLPYSSLSIIKSNSQECIK